MHIKFFAWCLAHNHPGYLVVSAVIIFWESKQLLFDANVFLRYVPVEDLLEIYKKLYGQSVITKNAIVDCSYLQFLEM